MPISFHELLLREDDAYNRGFQYGKELEPLIKKHIDKWRNIFNKDLHLAMDDVLGHASKIWPFVKAYSNEITREIEGITQGSGAKLEEIVMLNAINELYINRWPGLLGCTSFAVSDDATVDGTTYVGQTDDLMPWEAEFGVILQIQSADTQTIAFSFAGALPIIGMNDSGISMCINALYDGRSRPGVPVAIITADILHQKTIGQALYSIARAERATSVNLLIGDPYGELYSVEMTRDRYVPLYGENFIVHTNHFLSRDLLVPDLQERDMAVRNGTNSIFRYNRIRKLIHQHYGKIDTDQLKKFMMDHVNYPESICRHPVHEGLSQTIAAFIMNPEERTMLIADGNPCEATYYKYSIEKKAHEQ
jgi:isopenicillin-N N-acyltransferase like protein